MQVVYLLRPTLIKRSTDPYCSSSKVALEVRPAGEGCFYFRWRIVCNTLPSVPKYLL